MDMDLPPVALVLPEIVVLVAACVTLIVDLFLDDRRRFISYGLAMVGAVGGGFLAWTAYPGETVYAFNGMYVRDGLSTVLQVGTCILTAVVFLYSGPYIKERGFFDGEYFVLGLFALLGMMVMVSAHHLITIYLGIELLALSIYSMVAFNRDSPRAAEAAVKYFVLGSLASGILLYGMSILYGLAGGLGIDTVAAYVSDVGPNDIALMFALVFIVIGLAFKLGAVPFHMWIPDVYHGAPTSVTLFLATAPKLAAFGVVMRLLIEGLGGVHDQWQDMLIVLSVLSLVIGNIVAIAQTSIKRMLAYSTISHVGFLLLGILAGTEDGYGAALFYVIVYSIMAVGAFGVVAIMSRRGVEVDELDDFKGLNARSPGLAFVMLVLMFSMAGVPPTIGFYAKFVVISAVVDIGLVWLAVVAIVSAIVGAFYYLRVIRLMYFDEPDERVSAGTRDLATVVVGFNGLVVLAGGLFPGALMAVCLYAVSGF